MAQRKKNSYEKYITDIQKLLDMPLSAVDETTETLQRYVENSLNMDFADLKYNQLADIALSAKDEINNFLNSYLNDSVSQITKLAEESLKLSSEKRFEKLYQQIKNVDYGSLVKTSSIQSKSINDALHTAYSGVINAVEKDKDPNEYLKEEEVEIAFKEQISSYQKFSRQKNTWSVKKKIFYNIVIFIMINFIWPVFFQPYFQENLGMPVITKVECIIKSIPQSASEVIGRLDEGVEGTIIENSQYYYKVSYVDENGDEREGYIAKRNLKLIEEDDKSQK